MHAAHGSGGLVCGSSICVLGLPLFGGREGERLLCLLAIWPSALLHPYFFFSKESEELYESACPHRALFSLFLFCARRRVSFISQGRTPGLKVIQSFCPTSSRRVMALSMIAS